MVVTDSENSDKLSMTSTDASTSEMQSNESRDWTGLVQTSSNKDGVDRVEKVLHMYDIVFKDKDPHRSAPVRSHAGRQAAREQKRKVNKCNKREKVKRRHDCRRIIRTTYGHDGQIKSVLSHLLQMTLQLISRKNHRRKRFEGRIFSSTLVESNLPEK